MFRRASIVAALLGSFALVSAASAGTQAVYVGGHNAANLVRFQDVSERAPYALTGETRNVHRYETIRIDSRILVVRPVAK
jgi:hypothetical protein